MESGNRFNIPLKTYVFDRIIADGVWRVAFAFDPRRYAILLVAGDKSGGSESRFYKQLIKTADARFDEHFAQQMRKITFDQSCLK